MAKNVKIYGEQWHSRKKAIQQINTEANKQVANTRQIHIK